jgi:hypothetical protein
MSAAPISSVAKGALALVATIAAMLSVAASAGADANVSVSTDGHIRALATFHSIGDEFRICDRSRDNLPVGVRYSYIRKNDTTQRGQHWHSFGIDGVGNENSLGVPEKGCSFGDHNFGEGRRVWFQACVRPRKEGHLTCGDTQVTSTGPK